MNRQKLNTKATKEYKFLLTYRRLFRAEGVRQIASNKTCFPTVDFAQKNDLQIDLVRHPCYISPRNYFTFITKKPSTRKSSENNNNNIILNT